jgi:hypothetical protein
VANPRRHEVEADRVDGRHGPHPLPAEASRHHLEQTYLPVRACLALAEPDELTVLAVSEMLPDYDVQIPVLRGGLRA